ncbi:MAG: hypothetical protein J6C13_02180 [Clostridia bacterium]|nr:hypothetical protein [Clostridia bacterium]
MVITNTAKLFIRNGGLVWRILAYLLGCLLILGGLGLAICYPLIVNLSEAGFFTQLADIVVNSFANIRIDQIFSSISELIVSLGTIISQNIAEILPLVIVFVIIVQFFGYFLVGLSELAIIDCLYGYMGSNAKLGFANCFIKNLRKSLKLQLAKMLVVVPFNLIITCAVICCLMLFTTGSFIISVIAPFICVLVLALLSSIKSTLFCAWTPCMLARDYGVWYALKQSTNDVCKSFGKIFGRQFVMMICFIAINFAAWILTAGVGLLLTIPACILFNKIFGMVIYFYINGQRFYVDNDQIISPKKKEDWEPISNLKNVI